MHLRRSVKPNRCLFLPSSGSDENRDPGKEIDDLCRETINDVRRKFEINVSQLVWVSNGECESENKLSTSCTNLEQPCWRWELVDVVRNNVPRFYQTTSYHSDGCLYRRPPQQSSSLYTCPPTPRKPTRGIGSKIQSSNEERKPLETVASQLTNVDQHDSVTTQTIRTRQSRLIESPSWKTIVQGRQRQLIDVGKSRRSSSLDPVLDKSTNSTNSFCSATNNTNDRRADSVDRHRSIRRKSIRTNKSTPNQANLSIDKLDGNIPVVSPNPFHATCHVLTRVNFTQLRLTDLPNLRSKRHSKELESMSSSSLDKK